MKEIDRHSFECTTCSHWVETVYNYCPNCGKKVDKVIFLGLAFDKENYHKAYGVN